MGFTKTNVSKKYASCLNHVWCIMCSLACLSKGWLFDTNQLCCNPMYLILLVVLVMTVNDVSVSVPLSWGRGGGGVGQITMSVKLKVSMFSYTCVISGSNYYVRILSTIDRELLKPSASVALHKHSNALVDVLPPEADSSITMLQAGKVY